MPNMGSIISSHNHKILTSGKKLSPHHVPATVINLKTALCKDTAWEYNVLFRKQRPVPQIMPRNTTMVPLSQSSKVTMLITNRLANTPAREIRPSSPNTTGSCLIKVLIRRTSKLIGVSSDKPIDTSVAHGDASNRKPCDSPSRQIYHAQQEIRDRISMPTQNQKTGTTRWRRSKWNSHVSFRYVPNTYCWH